MNKKRWFKKDVVRAVHDNDLRHFLESIGVLSPVLSGDCKCQMCGSRINLENFGAVYPVRDTIHLVCDRTSCLALIDTESEAKDE